MNSSKNLLELLKTVSTVIVITALLFVVANIGAYLYIQSKPSLLKTKEHQINDKTAAERSKIMNHILSTDTGRLHFYGLESQEEVNKFYSDEGSFNEFQSYVHWKNFETPSENKHQRVHKAGYRYAGDYRIEGDDGPWPPNAKNFNIFFFGGSTAYGSGVPDLATVAGYLQDISNQQLNLKKNIYVYNFGRAGYQSTQEIFLLQLLLQKGFIPDATVHLDGLNDFCYDDGLPADAYIISNIYNKSYYQYYKNIDINNTQYEKYTKASIFSKLVNRIEKILSDTPAVRLMYAYLNQLEDKDIPSYDDRMVIDQEDKPSEELIKSVIDRYIVNMSIVEGIAKKFSFLPILVWQPIPTYKYDTKHHPFYPNKLGCHIKSKYGYPVFYDQLKYDVLSKNFIWAADINEHEKTSLFVDGFHYNAYESKKIAQFIINEIEARDLLR